MGTVREFWDTERIQQAVAALGRSDNVSAAVNALPFEATINSLTVAFRRRGMMSPSNYLRRTRGADPVPQTPPVALETHQASPATAARWASCSTFSPVHAAANVTSAAPEPAPCATPSQAHPEFAQLVDEARKSPDFATLCDRLDLAPSKVRQLIVDAQAAGVAIRTGAQVVALGNDPSPDIQETGIKPTVGEEQTIGVISDLHFGSKYCLVDEIRDCVERMYARGAREILMPGDLLDGCYEHGRFELTHVGIEDQTGSMCETLPQLPGLRYMAITGNHDETFFKPTGLNIGRYIEGYFRDNGRRDIKFYGDRGAKLRIRGTTVEMWHPMGSGSYAISYALQKRIESYDSLEKPGVLLTGHFHRSGYVHARGVHALLCPTMQRGGSRFGNALGKGSPSTGGLVLSWLLTEDATIREFSWRKINYYWREQPHETAA